MGQDAFDDDYGAIDNDTEVYRPEAHEIGRDTEETHQYKPEEHGERDDGGDNNTRTHIAKEKHQHEEDYHGALDKVVDDSRYVAVDKLRAVQIRLYGDTLRQHLLHLIYPLLQLCRHNIGVSALKHHGYATHTLALAVHRHSPETLGRAETDTPDVADMDRHAVAVGNNDALNILKA